MLVGEDMIFGMRHQAQYVSARVTDPGDIQLGSVRVEGITALPCTLARLLKRWPRIYQGNLIVALQGRGGGFIAQDEVTFAVGYMPTFITEATTEPPKPPRL